MSEPRDILSNLCERALLIGIRDSGESRQSAESHLEELEGLVESLGIPVAGTLLANLRNVHPHWLLGKGKIDEITWMIGELEADLVVFDGDLSPAQQRNLEEKWDIAVIDRQEVILDIFADRASSREAVLQVALARMHYSLPRLTRAWTHLSRQRGGARGNRGKGETQLETDRRLVLGKMARLKRDLDKVRQQRSVRRKQRSERPVPSVSLVGYTNAGKSSLLNALSGSGVYAADQLFATLDPSTRRVNLPGGREILITDTVGFIRKLPHDLVDAFHSTLEEALLADVILHVADAGHRDLDAQINVTRGVLADLGAEETYLLLNKSDLLSSGQLNDVLMRYPDGLTVSAQRRNGLDHVLEQIAAALDADRPEVLLHLPQDRWDLIARLHKESTVIEEQYDEDGVQIRVRLNSKERRQFAEFIAEGSG